MDRKLGASVQNCVCLSVCQKRVVADMYVSACDNCTTCCSQDYYYLLLGYICYVLFACECNVTETNPYAHFNVSGK